VVKDLAPKQQQMYPTLTPPVGWYQCPSLFIASLNTGTFTSGKIHFQPMWIGPQVWTTDSISFKVVGAQTGGTTSLVFGLYADDGTGWPDGTKQLATATATALTVAGLQTLTWSTAVAMTPGLYWIADLYVASVAPTTAATPNTLINASNGLAVTTISTGFGQNIRCYGWASQTALPTTALSSANVLSSSGPTDVPLVYLHRSA
jgi:hypothetical protein